MSPAEIIAVVSASTGVLPETIAAKGRHSRTVYARTMAVHLIRQQCAGWTLQNIGDLFDRSHSDIIHYLQRHRSLMAADAAYRATFESISQTN